MTTTEIALVIGGSVAFAGVAIAAFYWRGRRKEPLKLPPQMQAMLDRKRQPTDFYSAEVDAILDRKTIQQATADLNLSTKLICPDNLFGTFLARVRNANPSDFILRELFVGDLLDPSLSGQPHSEFLESHMHLIWHFMRVPHDKRIPLDLAQDADDVLCLCPCDGKVPTLGVLIALFFPKLKVISIDPEMKDSKWVHEETPKPTNLTCVGDYLSELSLNSFQDRKTLVVLAARPHVSFDWLWREWSHKRRFFVSEPCACFQSKVSDDRALTVTSKRSRNGATVYSWFAEAESLQIKTMA